MNKDDISAMRRELVYQKLLIHYVQDQQNRIEDELNKHRKELDDLERNLEQNLERVKAHQKFLELIKLIADLEKSRISSEK